MTEVKKKIKSLKALGSELAQSNYQLGVLNKLDTEKFSSKLKEIDLFPLKPTGVDVFQINMGKMCNQVCDHCHVDAGPDRKEIMTKETMQYCIDLIGTKQFSTVDLTGGAPEMNPDFRWFIEEIRKVNTSCTIIVRSNLTIIRANKKYYDLPEFFKKHNLEVTSSLPYFEAARTDKQRGEGVFEASIKALEQLNALGYGIPGSGLTLNLVYNPAGAFLPDSQESLEKLFKSKLKDKYNIVFNSLFAITNLPISRYLNYLVVSDNLEDYMEALLDAYNPVAAAGVMCRNTVSIGWDGFLYDCDFNQMLDLKVAAPKSQHLKDFDLEALNKRDIIINQHCYGCTAGAGSSCGGEVS
jgi:radical SAM/Cys-rich protein